MGSAWPVMAMDPVNHASKIPYYIQIRDRIRKQITTGVFAPGHRLPSESELASLFGVSRMTVRQGISELLAEGLLHRQHGVGTFVSQINIAANYTRLTGFTQDALDQGKDPASLLLGIENIPAPERVAKALALNEGHLVVHLERLRMADGQPVAIQSSYVPEEICPPNMPSYDWSNQSLFELLERNGLHLKRAIETIGALIADQDQANILEIDPGSAILYIERITFGEDGKPVEFVRMYNRPDRYRCTITLAR